MKNNDIFLRCSREIENSTSLEMLEVARRYSDLFLLKIMREGVNKTEVTLVDTALNLYYLNRYRKCH